MLEVILVVVLFLVGFVVIGLMPACTESKSSQPQPTQREEQPAQHLHGDPMYSVERFDSGIVPIISSSLWDCATGNPDDWDDAYDGWD